MLKKRLIFTLLWKNGKFCLSRNFRLQNVGDLEWLEKHYNFKKIALSIDELVILNVNREDKQMNLFAEQIIELTKGCFVPIAAGGGIRNTNDAKMLLNSGADKLVINTPLFKKPDLVQILAQIYGQQCIVASIDYKQTNGKQEVYTANGSESTGKTVTEAIQIAQQLGAGEIYLTSIEKDGTGQGYDFETLQAIFQLADVPIIASGGVGDFIHLSQWLDNDSASAASTANIFNFLGNGLIEARKHIEEQKIPLAKWDFDWKQ
jgi:imidazole glycerol-phosphate synthase subunit HisF